ncbi:uncharacterized protein TNCV_3896361 [Trichonephila clavipes]|nr:uncharacterized protein TNCV_3896361 [Trichonephila clavipes]
MTEEALVDHIFVRLEPQVQDYVEGSKNSGNVERRGWNESRRFNQDDRQRNWRTSEVLYRPNNGRNNYRGNYESGCQRNQWFESRNELNRDERRFDREYQSDKPGLTHVLHHEIDTGDKPPVVSRPYRYDRVKQSILDYHVEKMLKEGKNNTESYSVRVTGCVV